MLGGSDLVDQIDDCLDEIYSVLPQGVSFDEDAVINYLRSNDYNVDETIDYILNNYYFFSQQEKIAPEKKAASSQPTSSPLQQEISKSPAKQPAPESTKPASLSIPNSFSCFSSLLVDTLASALKQTPQQPSSSALASTTFSIVDDMLPRTSSKPSLF